MLETRHIDNVIGIVLAGGQARRMGGPDKAFAQLAGKPLIAWAIERASPQTAELILNANGDPTRFAAFGREVVADSIQGYLGPLAGILSGLEWMKRNRGSAKWLASFPCDTPFFPSDLVVQLIAKAQSERALVAVAGSGGRQHAVFAVWSSDIAETSKSILNEQGLRKMDDFVARLPHTRVEFATEPFDPFFNINTLEDLARAEMLMAKR